MPHPTNIRTLRRKLGTRTARRRGTKRAARAVVNGQSVLVRQPSVRSRLAKLKAL